MMLEELDGLFGHIFLVVLGGYKLVGEIMLSKLCFCITVEHLLSSCGMLL